MLKTDAANLVREVQNAQEFAALFLESYQRNRRKLPGPHFRSIQTADAPDSVVAYEPENVVHEWMTLVLPRITFSNPRMTGRSRRPGTQAAVATAIQHAENRWIRDTTMARLNRRLGADFGLAWFVAMTRMEERDGDLWREFDDPVLWPFVERISPARFFWDPMAQSPEECRFYGHVWVKDKEDLLEAAKKDPDTWLAGNIESLATGAGREYLNRSDEFEVDRNEIVGCSVWIPEWRDKKGPGPEDGYNGGIVDIAFTSTSGDVDSDERGGDGVFIRPLRPFYGPRWGPYTWCGAQIVPDETAFLSPITAAGPQIDDLNLIARREVSNAKTYRRLVFVNDANEDLSDAIENAPDRSVFATTGIKREDVTEVEIGGNTQQGVAQRLMQRETVDRAIGMDDAQRGMVGGNGTATEVAEAARNSGTRIDDMGAAFKAGIEQILRTVAWYLYHDDRVVMPLGPESAGELGMDEPWYFGGDDRKPAVRRTIARRMRDMGWEVPEPWLYGGDPEPGSGATFDDLELEIEAFSMERQNPQLRLSQMQAALGAMLNVAGVAPAAPYVDWQKLLTMLGEALDVPELGEAFDEMMFAALVAQGQQPQSGPRQIPMLGRDAGKAGQAKQQGSQLPAGAAGGMAGKGAAKGALNTMDRAQRTLPGGPGLRNRGPTAGLRK